MSRYQLVNFLDEIRGPCTRRDEPLIPWGIDTVAEWSLHAQG